uniref:Rs2 n=1 Tax=Arundo donax TaxID=35708 RepID=A0A0A9J329_ARUDO
MPPHLALHLQLLLHALQLPRRLPPVRCPSHRRDARHRRRRGARERIRRRLRRGAVSTWGTKADGATSLPTRRHVVCCHTVARGACTSTSHVFPCRWHRNGDAMAAQQVREWGDDDA